MGKNFLQGLLICFQHRYCLIALFVINILGSFYGYYWYWGQLTSTSKLLWLFVPDSPLSTTLFAGALFFHLTHRQVKVLPLLACAFLVKYGLWAVAVNLHLLWIGEGFTGTNLMLALSHFGMAVEGIIYFRLLDTRLTGIYVVSAILLFQDFMDYGVGLHPYLFSEAQYSFALHIALLLTGIILGFLWYYSYLLRIKRPHI